MNQPLEEADIPTQVAGLRAWVGAIDRIIGIRTRVLLVLVAIAIGGAGAAIYLSLQAGSDKASKADVNKLRDDVQSGGAAVGGDLETQVQAAQSTADSAQTSIGELQAEVDALKKQLNESDGGSGGDSGSGSGGDSGSGSGGDSGSGDSGGTKPDTGGTSPPND